MKNVFIRGSVVRYVHLPSNAVDIPLLEDATRRGKTPTSPLAGPTNEAASCVRPVLMFHRGGRAAGEGEMRLGWVEL